MGVIKKWKRRRPGVYAWRTDRHSNPGRREWAYVGESVHVGLRDRCHLGTCRHRTCQNKPWTDLRPVRYTIIPLPWWMGWKWVLRPLETLVILALAPRYNVNKNRWNPRRIHPVRAAAQRRDRDLWPGRRRARVAAERLMTVFIRATGVMLIVAGIVGTVVTKWH